MARVGLFIVRKTANGEYAVDQGDMYGFSVSYNPDDDRFYLHGPDGQDGSHVIARYESKSRGWANLLQFARRKSMMDAGKT